MNYTSSVIYAYIHHALTDSICETVACKLSNVNNSKSSGTSKDNGKGAAKLRKVGIFLLSNDFQSFLCLASTSDKTVISL